MVDDKEKIIPLETSDGKISVKTEDKPAGRKVVNPVAAEAIAPKAKPNPSKINESQKAVAERKATDLSKKPTHNEMMKSMRKQTKKAIELKEKLGILKQRPKPKSFPKPNI